MARAKVTSHIINCELINTLVLWPFHFNESKILTAIINITHELRMVRKKKKELPELSPFVIIIVQLVTSTSLCILSFLKSFAFCNHHF